ncbi:DUF3078 domain-containing protein [Candidatus Neomarinimicrobiota bacterium]
MRILLNTIGLIILCCGMVTIALGQDTEAIPVDTTWQNSLTAAFNFNQVGFENWAQGGENSIAQQIDLSGQALYQKDSYHWDNLASLKFGTSKAGDQSTRKTVDEIRISSVLTYSLSKFANPYIAVTGQTQLADGYKYENDTKEKISAFLDPGFFMQSVGLGYKPHANIGIRVGAALKETLTDQFSKPYTDDPETDKIEKDKIEAGLESVVEYNQTFDEKTTLFSKVELFSNLESFEKIDARWETKLTTKVTDLIQFGANLLVYYDIDISSKRQLYETVAIAISYTLK